MDKFINRLGTVVLFAAGLCIGHYYGEREGRRNVFTELMFESVKNKQNGEEDDGK